MTSAAAGARTAVVGLGYWGSNLARVLDELPGAELAWCCDVDPDRRIECGERFPGARFTTEVAELLDDPDLDAIAIATPVRDHGAMAMRVLDSGKDCFVEKPLAWSLDEATRVVAAAGAADRVLMVGHLLAYHPAVRALRGLIDEGRLGDVHYMHSRRLNLGRLRSDENALWSLGAHDVSVLLLLAGELPVDVSARGASYVRPGTEDVVFCLLRFQSGITAHLHLSWLDPHKERRMTVVGSQRMATFDDMAEGRRLTVFDKGFDPSSDEDYVIRSGSEEQVEIDATEPLRIELGHFVDCVRERRVPATDGRAGVEVVRVLDALQASMEAGGAVVEIDREAVA